MIYDPTSGYSLQRLRLRREQLAKPTQMHSQVPVLSSEICELSAICLCETDLVTTGDLTSVLATARDPWSTHPADGSHRSDPVLVCSKCIRREMNRANRKKSLSPSEEEWKTNARYKTVTFNEQELLLWKRVTQLPQPDLVDFFNGNPPYLSPCAVYVDVTIRITCYNRHHDEMVGFRYEDPILIRRLQELNGWQSFFHDPRSPGQFHYGVLA